MLADDPHPTDTAWWLGANTGIAIVVLIAVGFGLYRLLGWLGQNVVKPLTDRHLLFLDQWVEANRSIQETLREQVAVARQTLEELRKLNQG